MKACEGFSLWSIVEFSEAFVAPLWESFPLRPDVGALGIALKRARQGHEDEPDLFIYSLLEMPNTIWGTCAVDVKEEQSVCVTRGLVP